MKPKRFSKIESLTPGEAKAVEGFFAALNGRPDLSFVRAVIFGSRATGEGDEGSDIDILVLLSEATLERKHAVWDIAHDIFLNTEIDISPLVMSAEAFQRLRDHERLIAKEIDAKGIPL